MTQSSPTVSVCVPAFNAAPWIVTAVESALAQTYASLEVVVVDDASTDGTLDRVRRLDDPRLRVYENASNLGHSRNWNRSLSLARGRLVKFLCADDLLYPDCVEAMVALFESRPEVGLVFSLRDVEAESPEDPDTVAWLANDEQRRAIIGELEELNSGPELAQRWIASRLAHNAVGEPTNVMMTRDCLRKIGTFHLHVRQRADMDLWLRAMFFYDVGFVARPLARYLIRSGSVTDVNRTAASNWMDELWLLEGLLGYDAIRAAWPDLPALRRRAAARCVRHAVGRAMEGDWTRLAGLSEYVEFRMRGADPSRLYGRLSAPPIPAIAPTNTAGITVSDWPP